VQVHDECVEVVGEAFGGGGVGDDVLLVGTGEADGKGGDVLIGGRGVGGRGNDRLIVGSGLGASGDDILSCLPHRVSGCYLNGGTGNDMPDRRHGHRPALW
jgi:hypothetical protein